MRINFSVDEALACHWSVSMTFACERRSRMQSMQIHCLSLLFTKSGMELLAGRIFDLGTGTLAVGVLHSACCCGAEASAAGGAGAGQGSAVTEPCTVEAEEAQHSCPLAEEGEGASPPSIQLVCKKSVFSSSPAV